MANFLKSLFIKGVEIDTTGASNGNVLSYNGTKFAPAAPGSGSLALDDLSDVVVTSPEEFQGLSYNGTSWVNSHIPLVSYVRNAESTTITTGTVVYLFGATGDHATVKRADKSSDTTSSKTIGVAGANITASNNGPIVTRGYVDGIDLSVGYTAGDVLWLGDDGAFTTTKATAPDHLVFVGVVVRATNNGIIYVATQNGYELDELHNVSLPSPQSGEFLKYNGSLWVADAIDLGTDTTGNYMSGISGTSPVSVSHTPSEGSSATVSLASGYGDTQNPYDSKTANYFLAAPNGSAGAPTFRAVVAADIPTLNQSTTGNAATATTLQTSRNINGVAFNGSADITVTADAGTLTGTTLASGVTASSLTSVGTITSGTWSGSFGAVSGANLTTLNASNISSGTISSARLPLVNIGTTSVDLTRASGALTLAGITLTSPTFTTPTLGTPASGNLSNCTFPTLNQNTTGSAASLTTSRTIWGQSFNGSANVSGALSGATTISASSSVTATSFNIDSTHYLYAVSGDYGSIQVTGDKNAWAGYSINGNAVFMSNGFSFGLYDDTYNQWFMYKNVNGESRFYYAGTERMLIKSDGVSIRGDSSGTGVNGTLNAYAYYGNSNVDGTGNASYHPSGIYSLGSNWIYGTSNFAGNTLAGVGNGAPAANNTYYWGLGVFGVAAWAYVGSYNFYNPSDERYKQNIASLGLGLNFMRLLNPVEYTYLYPQFDEEHGNIPISVDEGTRYRAGLTAQNVKAALSELGAKDFNFWSLVDADDPENSPQVLDYTGLIGPVIQAIKELDAKVVELQARLAVLESN